jgi:MORN repeat
MMRSMLGCVLAAWLAVANAAPACKVADPELIGDFTGGCDAEGYATGPGAARGSAEYVGDFRRGLKHGRGVKTWPTGDRYVGDFVDDMKQGYGIYAFGAGTPWAGDRYLGGYQKDKRHGPGVYRWANGDSFGGEWDNDRFLGTATPMQQLQQAHAKEVAAAVKKPGIRVCREETVGITGKRRILGTVEAVECDRLRIRLEDGSVRLDEFLNWVPCN